MRFQASKQNWVGQVLDTGRWEGKEWERAMGTVAVKRPGGVRAMGRRHSILVRYFTGRRRVVEGANVDTINHNK